MEFIDLKAQYAALKQQIDAGIAGVLAHGQFIMGPEVAQFETQLAAYVGRQHCICCANGTDALQLVYMANAIGAGDAVFCPDVTFIASVEPACMLGAVPVFCDITADTYNLCPQSLERQIKAVLAAGRHRPRAVVAVDFLGNPADYHAISKICQKYNLLLIEDAAQGMGAEYHGNRCGSLGDVATTSFFPAKPLGCYGDGGAILTDDAAFAEKCRSMRVHGKGKSKYDNIRIGVNSRLDTLQAAILIPKLKALAGDETDAREKVARRYDEAFDGRFITPHVAEDCRSIYAQYALLAESEQQRDVILDRLTVQNIPSMVYYPKPQHLLEVFAHNAYLQEDFSNSAAYCNRTFSLPMHPYLSEAEQARVIAAALERK